MSINIHSETWLSISTHCNARLESLRLKLEGDLSFDDSIKLRAQIKELRGILSLGEVDTPLVPEPDMLPE